MDDTPLDPPWFWRAFLYTRLPRGHALYVTSKNFPVYLETRTREWSVLDGLPLCCRTWYFLFRPYS